MNTKRQQSSERRNRRWMLEIMVAWLHKLGREELEQIAKLALRLLGHDEPQGETILHQGQLWRVYRSTQLSDGDSYELWLRRLGPPDQMQRQTLAGRDLKWMLPDGPDLESMEEP